jgi:S1-C subfamily serine protease
MVFWSGAILHKTPLSISAQRNVAPSGIYISWASSGSPSQAFQLYPTRRVLAVDDHAVADLDQFLAAVAGRPDGSSVRLRTASLDGRESVVTLKLDLLYWPTAELRLGANGWERLAR